MKGKRMVRVGLVGGAFWAFIAIMKLISVLSIFKWSFLYGVFNLAMVATFGWVAYCMLSNHRDILTAVGMAILAIFYFGLSLDGLIVFGVMALLAFIAFVHLTGYFNQYKDACAQIWFLPGVVYAVYGLFESVMAAIQGHGISGVIGVLLTAVALLCQGKWIVAPDTMIGK